MLLLCSIQDSVWCEWTISHSWRSQGNWIISEKLSGSYLCGFLKPNLNLKNSWVEFSLMNLFSFVLGFCSTRFLELTILCLFFFSFFNNAHCTNSCLVCYCVVIVFCLMSVSKVCRDSAADTSWWQSAQWSGFGSQWVKGRRTGQFHVASDVSIFI